MKKTADDSFHSYSEAEEFLLSLVNYEQLPPPMTNDAEGWHLREFSDFLDKLNNPQKNLSIIHVAGTKGKGSTTRMIAAMLSALGWKRVGAFTSPHIESFRERISINGRSISEEDFVQALNAIRAAHPIRAGEGFRTTFEVLTAMAFWHFQKMKCDAVVLETGLGGRLDSTNVALARVALITTIGFEHQRVLGSTLEAIAREKAGIIKPGTDYAIVGPQLPHRKKTVVRVAESQAQKASVPLAAYGPDDDMVQASRPHDWGFELDLRIAGEVITNVRLHTLGQHQINNLRGAWMAVQKFCEMENRKIDAGKIREGIETFRSPGRLEMVSESPCILADAAHCPISIKAALDACADHFPNHPVILVLGLMHDKKPQPILQNIAKMGSVCAVFTYTPPSPRARSGENLGNLAKAYLGNVESCRDIEQAMTAALRLQRKQPKALILSTGTAYSIAQVRRWVREFINKDKI